MRGNQLDVRWVCISALLFCAGAAAPEDSADYHRDCMFPFVACDGALWPCVKSSCLNGGESCVRSRASVLLLDATFGDVNCECQDTAVGNASRSPGTDLRSWDFVTLGLVSRDSFSLYHSKCPLKCGGHSPCPVVDAVIITDRELHSTLDPSAVRCHSPAWAHLAGPQVSMAPWVVTAAWLIEPRAINPASYAYVEKHWERFDLIFSHHKQLKVPSSRLRYLHFGTSLVPPQQRAMHPKTKLVSLLASARHNTQGHLLRHDMAQQLGCGKAIDCFGEVVGMQHLPNKVQAIQDYMFTISVENSQDDTYFSEKLLDCFLTGTIPIYWGAKSAVDMFDAHGVIFIENMRDAHEALLSLSPDLYAQMLPAASRNFEAAQRYLDPLGHIWSSALRDAVVQRREAWEKQQEHAPNGLSDTALQETDDQEANGDAGRSAEPALASRWRTALNGLVDAEAADDARSGGGATGKGVEELLVLVAGGRATDEELIRGLTSLRGQKSIGRWRCIVGVEGDRAAADLGASLGYDERITVFVGAPAGGRSVCEMLRWLVHVNETDALLEGVKNVIWLDGRDWFTHEHALAHVETALRGGCFGIITERIGSTLGQRNADLQEDLKALRLLGVRAAWTRQILEGRTPAPVIAAPCALVRYSLQHSSACGPEALELMDWEFTSFSVALSEAAGPALCFTHSPAIVYDTSRHLRALVRPVGHVWMSLGELLTRHAPIPPMPYTLPETTPLSGATHTLVSEIQKPPVLWWDFEAFDSNLGQTARQTVRFRKTPAFELILNSV